MALSQKQSDLHFCMTYLACKDGLACEGNRTLTHDVHAAANGAWPFHAIPVCLGSGRKPQADWRRRLWEGIPVSLTELSSLHHGKRCAWDALVSFMC